MSRPGHALLFVIVGPVGPYFATGAFNPVSLLADPRFVRACRGGVGAYKMGRSEPSHIALSHVNTHTHARTGSLEFHKYFRLKLAESGGLIRINLSHMAQENWRLVKDSVSYAVCRHDGE